MGVLVEVIGNPGVVGEGHVGKGRGMAGHVIDDHDGGQGWRIVGLGKGVGKG